MSGYFITKIGEKNDCLVMISTNYAKKPFLVYLLDF